MEKFTYEDYLRYVKKKNFYIMLKEDSEEYKINKIHQYKDKGFKMVLEDKEEAIQLINKTLKIENTKYAIRKEEIEKYNSSFITQDFKSKESDIVYKKKEEDIFFLIEQQSQVDYSMAYRILNYCIEIIRNAVNKKKLKNKGYKMPVVYPIVLYTGKRKWNAKEYFEECQMRLEGVDKTTFASYNLIDIHNYTEEELWKEKNFLSKMLLFEKAKEKDKMAEYFRKIEKENLSNKEINILVQMMCGSLNRTIGEIAIKEFIEKMKNKKGGSSMLSALEKYFDSVIEEGIEKGREEGKKVIVLRMLKRKMDEKTIKSVTQITQKELNEIKKQNTTTCNDNYKRSYYH